MNLVHLIPYYAPAWGFGGVVHAAYGLTRALAAHGNAVTVITTDAGDNGMRLPAGESVIDGVQVIRCCNALPALRRVNLSSPLGLREALRTALAGAAVLHVHEFRTVENLIALPLAHALGVPVILSPHGTLPYHAGRGALKRGWDRLFGRWSASHIDHVLALTADEAADARALWNRLGLPLADARISVIPNGVDVGEFAALPPRGLFRARYGIPPGAPLILFLGRLHRRKGVHHLIDALPALPEAWLAVVGPDEGEGAALRSRAAALGVAERVLFTGLLAGPDRLAALSGADVLGLPAVGEGLPMVALEALAAGLPVALSDECHLPEVIEAGAGVRLEVLNGANIAEALRPLLDDPSQRQAMRSRGRALVEARFTWDAVTRQVEDAYRRQTAA